MERNPELDKNIINILGNLAKTNNPSSVSLCDLFDYFSDKYNLKIKQVALSHHIKSFIRKELFFRTNLEISEQTCYQSRLQKFIINSNLIYQENPNITKNILNPKDLIFPEYVPEQIVYYIKPLVEDKSLDFSLMSYDEIENVIKEREMKRNVVFLLDYDGKITHQINLTNVRANELSLLKNKIITNEEKRYVLVKKLSSDKHLSYALSDEFNPTVAEIRRVLNHNV